MCTLNSIYDPHVACSRKRATYSIAKERPMKQAQGTNMEDSDQQTRNAFVTQGVKLTNPPWQRAEKHMYLHTHT